VIFVLKELSALHRVEFSDCLFFDDFCRPPPPCLYKKKLANKTIKFSDGKDEVKNLLRLSLINVCDSVAGKGDSVPRSVHRFDQLLSPIAERIFNLSLKFGAD
jgi:hypothetical protein